MRRPSKLRQIARSIPALYWLAGFVRHLRFRRALRIANRGYASETSALPPPMLRYRVHGALDEASYLQVGRDIASRLVQCLSSHGVALEDATLLDFACGPGRVA